MKLLRQILKVRHLTGYYWVNSQSTNEISQNYEKKYSFYTANIQNSKNPFIYKCAFGILGIGMGYGIYRYLRTDSLTTVLAAEPKHGVRIKSLPTFSMKEISTHCSKEKGVWVIFKNGVYDITDFLDKHPGGDKIMMAAGGSIEPFWMMYGVHYQDHILAMLEQYRIGNLDADEMISMKDESDPYSQDPLRHPVLRPSCVKPFNAEPPPELLVDSFITPQDIFYVRNHLPVPEVDLDNYELEVSGNKLKTVTLTLNDLKKFPEYTITASIQCAGNRRSEMTEIKAVKGLNWGHAAIGNATWTGIRLRDLLLHLGFNENSGSRHVQFEGLDCDPSGSPYGSSITIEKALDPNGDVLLAYKMNGQPLSRDHGFPLRAVVPGIVGARNVKWLSRIIISEDESPAHWQQNDYKGFGPNVDWDTVDFKTAPAIQELPVISAVCSPSPGQTVALNYDGTVTVKGYAWSGGGRKIIRVDVTCDGGKIWRTAEITNQDSAVYSRNWAWTLWTLNLPVPEEVNEKGLVIGAYDGCNPGEVKFTRTAKMFDDKTGGKISQLIKGGVKINKGTAQVFSNLGDEFHSVALAGLGEEGAGYNPAEILDECKENIRWAAGTGARALQDTGITQIFVEAFENAEAAAEGANLAIWQYQDMRNPADHKPNPKLDLFDSTELDMWRRGIGKSECQNLARRLEEAPGNLMTPTSFAQWTLEALCPCGIQVEVRDRDWLETQKMSALLTISKGSCEEPLVLEVGYCGGKVEDKPITFVAKGVTFDTGGLCLKKCEGMSVKRGDIAGAAVVVGAIKCAAMMALPLNIKAILPVMESMMGGSAVKPGDVITSLHGKTVCIENPDNEGRVMMIDPLVFCLTYYPCLVGTIASLTGATTRGLGSAASAMFSTSNDVWREMERAGSETGDRVWRFPFWKYFTEKVTGYPSIDVNNVGLGDGGQPCLGAAFLKEFTVPDIDFFHIDIHGTGIMSRGNNIPYLRKGLMTGRPVRTVSQFLYQVACPHEKGDACS